MTRKTQTGRLPLGNQMGASLERVIDSPVLAGGYFYFYFTLRGAELHAGWGNG